RALAGRYRPGAVVPAGRDGERRKCRKTCFFHGAPPACAARFGPRTACFRIGRRGALRMLHASGASMLPGLEVASERADRGGDVVRHALERATVRRRDARRIVRGRRLAHYATAVASLAVCDVLEGPHGIDRGPIGKRRVEPLNL